MNLWVSSVCGYTGDNCSNCMKRMLCSMSWHRLTQSCSFALLFHDSVLPLLFAESFTGHFDNTIVLYQQPPKLHFNNTVVLCQLPIRFTSKHLLDWLAREILNLHNMTCYSRNTYVFLVWCTNICTYIQTDTACVQHVNVGLTQARPNYVLVYVRYCVLFANPALCSRYSQPGSPWCVHCNSLVWKGILWGPLPDTPRTSSWCSNRFESIS